MNGNIKIKGQLKLYMQWPVIMVLLLLLMDLCIFRISIKGGVIATCFIAVYLAIAVFQYHNSRADILNELISFATQYGQVQKSLLRDFIVPYALVDGRGRILWMNEAFSQLSQKPVKYHRSITSIFQEITIERLPKDESSEVLFQFENRDYRASMRKISIEAMLEDSGLIESDADNFLTAIYIFDETDVNRYKKERDEEKLVTGLLYLDNYEEALEALKRVFGIAYICPVVIKEDQGYEQLEKDVVAYVDHVYPDKNKSFKMHVRRAKKTYPGTSMELNADLGGAILDAFPEMKVDVHNPQLLITVEIREKIYIYSESIPGPGGMPIGTNGKAMLLLSGGIDSPVAGYMIAKRGVKIDAVYFHAPPYTSERAKQKVVDLAKLVARYSGPINLYVVNFTDIQLYIYDQCPHDELTIIMRRYMMKIAERIGKEQGCLGLITGESIGQVASQTVQSLAATNEVCTMPVFRPVIGFDKQEIVDISLKINTYETSIQPYEDCCTIFVAKHPVTKPNIQMIKKSEKKLEEKIDEMMDQAVNTAERIYIEA